MLEGDFIFEVALPPDRTEPSLGSGLRPDQGWRDCDLVIAPYDQEYMGSLHFNTDGTGPGSVP